MKPEEAHKLLNIAEAAEAEGRLRLSLLGGWSLVLWGGIWTLGYGLAALAPAWAGLFWVLAAPLGILVSFFLGIRQGRWVQSERGHLTFALWGLLTLFYLYWSSLLSPKGLAGQGLLVSLVALGLALTGRIWQVRGLLSAGLGLFLLDALLYHLLPQAFPWGMALAGFGAFLYGTQLLWRWTR
ncbi:hypothetical protein Mlute_00233 [Meiothermus luteus]|uniref:Acid-resistance membrane protein n=1 Tax=Meiothermus luteus TaxID=2026184 RepID=A0A399F164_9DEIN|nr:hypothetical protein [Meiothermus luteus]RIH89720.1 hypothetical protein Mlute_00233 [Meiothermus luteus]RMH57827.1 MAG: hypothetical protein D6684_02520 [Deinococcota bacterium]